MEATLPAPSDRTGTILLACSGDAATYPLRYFYIQAPHFALENLRSNGFLMEVPQRATNSVLAVALFDTGTSGIERQSSTLIQRSVPRTPRIAWLQPVPEFIGTCCALIAIAIGVLTLRFTLVLMNVVLH